MDKKRYCQITVNVSPFEFKTFKKMKEDFNLSAREVLEYSGCPCDRCKNTFIIAYHKITGEEIKIPRGILSKKI